MNLKKNAKRLVVSIATATMIIGGGFALADPAAIVQTSPVGRMETAGEVSSYLYNGRTRINLPQDVLTELNEWSTAYTARLEEWNAEDGADFDAYYGGLQEGYNYAYSMILSRLGYIDAWEADETLQNVPDGWDQSEEGQEFFAWENAGFGAID